MRVENLTLSFDIILTQIFFLNLLLTKGVQFDIHRIAIKVKNFEEQLVQCLIYTFSVFRLSELPPPSSSTDLHRIIRKFVNTLPHFLPFYLFFSFFKFPLNHTLKFSVAYYTYV